MHKNMHYVWFFKPVIQLFHPQLSIFFNSKKITVTGIFIIFLVAAGFPSGQYPLHTKIAEIQYAVVNGATEIDIVISRTKVLTQDWQGKFFIMYAILLRLKLRFAKSKVNITATFFVINLKKLNQSPLHFPHKDLNNSP